MVYRVTDMTTFSIIINVHFRYEYFTIIPNIFFIAGLLAIYQVLFLQMSINLLFQNMHLLCCLTMHVGKTQG